MTQEIVRFEEDYDGIQDHLRPHLAQAFQDLARRIQEQADEDGHITAQHALVLVSSLREFGRLYRVYDNPGRERMVPEAEVQKRIQAAVEDAVAREVPLAIEDARRAWEAEKKALEAGMRARALERVRAQGF
jgi:hypothetical protein